MRRRRNRCRTRRPADVPATRRNRINAFGVPADWLIGGAGQAEKIQERRDLAREQGCGQSAQATDELEMLARGEERVQVCLLGDVADSRTVLDQAVGDIATVEPDL